MIALLLAACIPNGTVKLPADCTPDDVADGWTISSPEAEGLDRAAVESLCTDLFAEDEFLNVRTLHVVANGKLVVEAAFQDRADLDEPHLVQSMTKSVTSLVTGTAVDGGFVSSVDEPIDTWIGDSFPAGEPTKQEITVGHLLTMSSGIDVSNTTFGIQVLMKGKDDSIAWLLDQPLYATPGERMVYRDADPHLLAAALEGATGQPFEQYAQDALFAPLGIEDATIEASPDGHAIAAAGLRIRPRDLARIGQMVLDGGTWQGKRVVSEEWLDASTAFTVYPTNPGLEDFGYGYYWWLLPDIGAFTAVGHGGQFLTVFPEQDVVVALTATSFASPDVGIDIWEWEPLVARVIEGL